MMDSNNTSMEVTNNYGFLSKIVKIIKSIFKKDNVKYITEGTSDNTSNRNNNTFFKSIKFEQDPEKAMLLKIQDDFEKMGINKENAYKLTKDLTNAQKTELENLYRQQIRNYQISINNYKNKIIDIRKKLSQTNN